MSKNENKAGKPKNTKPCNRVIARFVGGGDKEDRTPDLLTASLEMGKFDQFWLNHIESVRHYISMVLSNDKSRW